jgi:outer membrane protein OmpA-like peptidoglycan-associated protein
MFGDPRDEEPQEDPWSSVVDLMAAFALVLFLAVMFFIINTNLAQEKLKERNQQLRIQKSALRQSLLTSKKRTNSLIASRNTTAKLRQIQLALQKKNKAIQEQFALLQLKKKETDDARTRLLADKDALLAAQKRLKQEKLDLTTLLSQKAKMIQQNQALIDQKKTQMNQQKALLSEVKHRQQRCENKLKDLLRKQKRVLNAIHQVFTSRSSKVSGVGFDKKTGKFRLGGEVLFEEGSDVLKANGKKQLRAVYLTLSRVIWRPSVRSSIAGIMIEGHTSQSGKAWANWVLAHKRSLAALRYLLSLAASQGRSQQLTKLLYAAAFGQYRPILRRNGTPDSRRSRRIEIKVVFKNQAGLKGVLQGLQP